jgi:hypothetical protein
MSEAKPRSKARNAPPGAIDEWTWCYHCLKWRPLDLFPPRQLGEARYWIDVCADCRAETARRWRERHPEEVAARNESRRFGEREGRCIDCAGPFVFKSANAKRCPDCRRRRKIDQRRQRRGAQGVQTPSP